MARKMSNNLAFSKKSEMSVEVFEAEKYSKFTHSFKIPFKKSEGFIPTHVSVFRVINTFADEIVGALEARMESCMDMLSRNLFNVVESNEFSVIFKKEDGSYHIFNHMAFNAMKEAISFIRDEEIKDLRSVHYDQILKALYWVEKPAPRNGISFGNLISVCMEGFFLSEK